MQGKGFTFRQFHVRQDGAAMKVTTDACVFGAWIPGPLHGRLLDAGTGTGLLALMLAQRFPELQIAGVELDDAAWRDASHNFSHSPFADRLDAVKSDVLQYPDEFLFNAIVCNPPFFHNALPSTNPTRNMARHLSDVFTVDGFLDAVNRLLRPDGSLFLLLPPAEGAAWLEKAAERSIFPYSICRLQHDEMRKPHRWMLALRRQIPHGTSACVESHLLVYEKGQYSEQVRALLSPFYLHLD